MPLHNEQILVIYLSIKFLSLNDIHFIKEKLCLQQRKLSVSVHVRNNF